MGLKWSEDFDEFRIGQLFVTINTEGTGMSQAVPGDIFIVERLDGSSCYVRRTRDGLSYRMSRSWVQDGRFDYMGGG